MNYRFGNNSEKLIAGIPVFGKPESGLHSWSWVILMPLIEKIPGRINLDICFGVEWYTDDFMKTGEIFYLAGVEIDDVKNLPDYCGCKYTCSWICYFEAVGGIKGIHKVWDYFHPTWKTKNGYDIARDFHFELYDQRFKGIENPETIFEIYIPIVDIS